MMDVRLTASRNSSTIAGGSFDSKSIARSQHRGKPHPANDQSGKIASRGYLSIRCTVGLKILKNKLSEYVRLAADGETIMITDRGHVVAEMVPPRRHHHETFVERGVREGWLTTAKRQFQPLPPRKPITRLTLERLLADRDRGDRW